MVDDRLYVVEGGLPVPRAVARAAVAAQVHRDDAAGAGEQRRDGVPVQQGAAEAVQQQHGRPVAAVVADGQVDGAIVDDQVLRCHGMLS